MGQEAGLSLSFPSLERWGRRAEPRPCLGHWEFCSLSLYSDTTTAREQNQNGWDRFYVQTVFVFCEMRQLWFVAQKSFPRVTRDTDFYEIVWFLVGDQVKFLINTKLTHCFFKHSFMTAHRHDFSLCSL